MDKKSRNYEVCLCHHITRGQIEDFIEKTGITDLNRLCAEANVGNKCGGCREDIQSIIDDMK